MSELINSNRTSMSDVRHSGAQISPVCLAELQMKLGMKTLDVGQSDDEESGMEMLKLITPASSMKERYRENIIKEIISSEKYYLASLKTLVKEFIQNSIVKQVGKEDARLTLWFHYVEQITQLNSHLFKDMKKSKFPDKTGETFLGHLSIMKLYVQYSRIMEEAMDALKVHRKNCRDLNDFIDSLKESNAMSKQSVESLAIMPIQRIPRYTMLLQDLLRNTEQSHKDYESIKKCVAKFEEVAESMNEGISKIHQQRVLVQLSKEIVFCNSDASFDVTKVGRKLIKEGHFVVLDSSQKIHEYYIILFNDHILFCSLKKSKIGLSRKVIVHHVYHLDSLSCSSVPKTIFSSTEHGVPFMISSSDTSLIVFAQSKPIQKEWVSCINESIEKCLKSQRHELQVYSDISLMEEESPSKCSSQIDHNRAFPISKKSVKNCMGCEKKFKLLSRRFNCTDCGQVVCQKCLFNEEIHAEEVSCYRCAAISPDMYWRRKTMNKNASDSSLASSSPVILKSSQIILENNFSHLNRLSAMDGMNISLKNLENAPDSEMNIFTERCEQLVQTEERYHLSLQLLLDSLKDRGNNSKSDPETELLRYTLRDMEDFHQDLLENLKIFIHSELEIGVLISLFQRIHKFIPLYEKYASCCKNAILALDRAYLMSRQSILEVMDEVTNILYIPIRRLSYYIRFLSKLREIHPKNNSIVEIIIGFQLVTKKVKTAYSESEFTKTDEYVKMKLGLSKIKISAPGRKLLKDSNMIVIKDNGHNQEMFHVWVLLWTDLLLLVPYWPRKKDEFVPNSSIAFELGKLSVYDLPITHDNTLQGKCFQVGDFLSSGEPRIAKFLVTDPVDQKDWVEKISRQNDALASTSPSKISELRGLSEIFKSK